MCGWPSEGYEYSDYLSSNSREKRPGDYGENKWLIAYEEAGSESVFHGLRGDHLTL